MRASLGLLLLAACHGADDHASPGATAPPELGTAPTVEIVSAASDGLDVPRDLAFHPDHPDQLWVVNRADDSMVIYTDPGGPSQTSEKRIDVYAFHFMEEVSSIAFGAPDDTVDDHPISTFGTCQESRNTYDGESEPNDFMGPALWPGDLDLFAEVNQVPQSLGSHIDMLHESPLCMGIAHETANRYWVFDGRNGDLVWYDFEVPHGYGEDDHSDGRVRRYDVPLARVPDVPGHLEMDADGVGVFVADTGTGRVLRVDPSTAQESEELDWIAEPLGEYTAYTGATVRELVTGLGEPSGLARVDDRLYVSDHATGDVIAFDAGTGEELGRVQVGAGVMGLAIGPDGRIWFVNGETDEVGVVVPGPE